jgi:hypothetical protein
MKKKEKKERGARRKRQKQGTARAANPKCGTQDKLVYFVYFFSQLSTFLLCITRT